MEANKVKKEKKPSIIFKIIKGIFSFIFSGLRVNKMNKDLNIAYKIKKDPWFKKQIRRNRLVSLVLLLPLVLSLMLSFKIINNDSRLKRGVTKTFSFAKKLEIKNTVEMIKITFDNKLTRKRIKVSRDIIGISILISFILGWMILKFHPVLQATNRLKMLLDKNGSLDPEDRSPVVLATPLGYLIKISGNSSADNIMNEDSRIWRVMNVKVDSFIEADYNRSLVFYNKRYELKKSYPYIID